MCVWLRSKKASDQKNEMQAEVGSEGIDFKDTYGDKGFTGGDSVAGRGKKGGAI